MNIDTFGATDTADPLARMRQVALRLFDDAPGYAGTALLLTALAVPTAVANVLDARTIDGVGIWIKPLKFHLALGIYCLTLAFYARFVPPGVRDGRGWRIFTTLVIGAILAETAWLMYAATIGERAHFNRTHAQLALLYPIMGVLAAILTAATTQFAWSIHRHTTGLSPAIKSGLVWGLGLTLPLTLVTALYLAAGSGHHVLAGATGPLVGSGGVDVNGLAFFGWSRSEGDLRVAHFFATHSLHGVPLLAVTLAMLGWTNRWAGRIAALSWTVLVGVAFFGAIEGQPFL